MTDDEILTDLHEALGLLAAGVGMAPLDPRQEEWREEVERFLHPRWPRFVRRNTD